MENLTYSFTNKEVTPWGGMVFMKQMLDKIGFRELITSCDVLPTQNSNRGHSVLILIESFLTSIWCGANRFLHTEVTRSDKALSKIFGWENVPGNDAYKRYFNKFSQGTNQRVCDHFFSWFFENIQLNHFTLDIDSTIMTRYGQQQGANKGYNPKKRGRNSHHPLMAFVNDVRMVANFWLRSGDANTANNFVAFLEDTLSKFGNKTVGLTRLDSGFCSNEVMSYLESKQMKYIVAARFSHPIQRLIDMHDLWTTIDDGVQICDKVYQANSWSNERRIVIVRQKISERPQATGKQLSLFPEDEVHKNYRYSAYFTNEKYGAIDVWRTYRGRGDAENRIKELKNDFGADSFNLKNFFATEAALQFVMIAYNLMSLFRHLVLQEKTQRTLSTIRYRNFAIGAYFEKVNGILKLRISLIKKRRNWFAGLWDYPLEYPLKLPNA